MWQECNRDAAGGVTGVRHKAGRAARGLSCVARFERSACVFADRGAFRKTRISSIEMF